MYIPLNTKTFKVITYQFLPTL